MLIILVEVRMTNSRYSNSKCANQFGVKIRIETNPEEYHLQITVNALLSFVSILYDHTCIFG